MNDFKQHFGIFYSRWYSIILWMIGISLIIGLIFTLFIGRELTFINVLLPSLFNTAFIWGGSMGIVVFVWRKFPWELYPAKHILVEFLMITLFLSVFITGMNLFYCHQRNTEFIEGLKLNTIDILFTVMITFLIVTIHEAIFFYRQWKLNFSKSVSLEKDNIEAQYNALKAQVNPHFLFNSLNSLMSLIEDNPQAEKYVQNLSDFLRYVLVSNTRETVTLNEELIHVEKYIHLQKIRFGENYTVEFKLSPVSLQRNIPPLALQMLLENCFNHNVISKSKPLNIKIFSDDISLSIENNLQKKAHPESTGQGLKNIEGRYRFVEGQSVKVVSDNNRFLVTIPLI